MDQGKRVAIALAVIVLLIIASIGVFLILSSGAPKKDLSWAPTITPYVDDRVGLMTYNDYHDLDEFCYEVELNNTCQIAVLIVNTTQPYGINDYAVGVFEKNGIGQSGKDNGVLFVFSYAENSWRVLTGKGVADILNGAKLTELRQLYFDAYIANGNYSEGIKLYTYAIGLELVDHYVNSGGNQTNYPISWIPLADWQLGIVVVVLVVLVIATKGRIIIWIPYLVLALIGRGGGGRWGGGSTGGGGARGRF